MIERNEREPEVTALLPYSGLVTTLLDSCRSIATGTHTRRTTRSVLDRAR